MADLSRRAGGDRGRRGQLLLVTALSIAVVLVALVLLVNSAIYAENLATRNTDIGESDALAYRSGVIEGAGGTVDRENRAEYADRAALEENVTAGVERLDALLARTHLDHGVDANVDRSSVAYVDGRLVRQTDPSRNFTDETGLVANWTVAYDTNGTRRYAATVDRDALVQTDETDLSGAFRLVIVDNSTGEEWRVFLYEDDDTGNLTVAVRNATESSPTVACSVDRSTATVNFTNESLSGRDCPALEWAEGVGERYDIAYRNGDNAVGTYNLTVRTEDAGALNTLDLNALGGGSPYHVPAVYAATMSVSYESPTLSYRDSIRVARGEPDG